MDKSKNSSQLKDWHKLAKLNVTQATAADDLVERSTVKSLAAKRMLAVSVVKLQEHLVWLSTARDDDKIGADDRKVIPSTASGIARGLDKLGLVEDRTDPDDDLEL